MKRWGISPKACAEAAWAVTPEGRRYRGAGAVLAALFWALGCPGLMRVYDWPGVRQVADVVYAWVAAHRARLPGVTPYCRQYPDMCQEAKDDPAGYRPNARRSCGR